MFYFQFSMCDVWMYRVRHGDKIEDFNVLLQSEKISRLTQAHGVGKIKKKHVNRARIYNCTANETKNSVTKTYGTNVYVYFPIYIQESAVLCAVAHTNLYQTIINMPIYRLSISYSNRRRKRKSEFSLLVRIK